MTELTKRRKLVLRLMELLYVEKSIKGIPCGFNLLKSALEEISQNSREYQILVEIYHGINIDKHIQEHTHQEILEIAERNRFRLPDKIYKTIKQGRQQ